MTNLNLIEHEEGELIVNYEYKQLKPKKVFSLIFNLVYKRKIFQMLANLCKRYEFFLRNMCNEVALHEKEHALTKYSCRISKKMKKILLLSFHQ